MKLQIHNKCHHLYGAILGLGVVFSQDLLQGLFQEIQQQ